MVQLEHHHQRIKEGTEHQLILPSQNRHYLPPDERTYHRLPCYHRLELKQSLIKPLDISCQFTGNRAEITY